MNFHIEHRHRRVKGSGFIVWLLLGFIALAIISVGALTVWYQQQLQAVAPQDNTEMAFVISEGQSAGSISSSLEQERLIKSKTAFDIYVRLNRLRQNLQAGTYSLSPSDDVETISMILTSGAVKSENVTILPAQRIDQIRDILLESGYGIDEVEKALQITSYAGHPVLQYIPKGASLEGYIYPETFAITDNTPAKEVIEASLDEFVASLDQSMVNAFNARGLSVHQAVILSSIVEREVSNQEDRTKVAQVFLTRLERNIALGSDPTALYGALLAGLEPSVSTDTLYNTRLYPGLPPGPINNVSVASLQAVALPAQTDFLFFVSGDDGKTYFSQTIEEHEALTAQHCVELCRSY